MIKKITLAILISLTFTKIANAQTCTPAPSCGDLGYTMSLTDCASIEHIKCPFDMTKVYCNKECAKKIADKKIWKIGDELTPFKMNGKIPKITKIYSMGDKQYIWSAINMSWVKKFGECSQSCSLPFVVGDPTTAGETTSWTYTWLPNGQQLRWQGDIETREGYADCWCIAHFEID